jgi:hypothetical protein
MYHSVPSRGYFVHSLFLPRTGWQLCYQQIWNNQRYNSDTFDRILLLALTNGASDLRTDAANDLYVREVSGSVMP